MRPRLPLSVVRMLIKSTKKFDIRVYSVYSTPYFRRNSCILLFNIIPEGVDTGIQASH